MRAGMWFASRAHREAAKAAEAVRSDKWLKGVSVRHTLAVMQTRPTGVVFDSGLLLGSPVVFSKQDNQQSKRVHGARFENLDISD